MRQLRPALAAIGLVLLIFYLHGMGLEWDTGALIGQTRASLACIARGQWTGCAAGGSFPLLQKIPVAMLLAAGPRGLKDGTILRVLASLNFAVFLAAFFFAGRSLARRSRAAAWIFALTLAVGPFLWYARSSFSEMLAAALTLLFLVGCREGWANPLVFALLVLAGLSKETAAPFLAALGALALVLRRRPEHHQEGDATQYEEGARPVGWAEGIAIVGGACAAVALNVLHNFFRFHSALNAAYLDPLNLVHHAGTHLDFFLALVFAPNGGLLFFWPLALAVLAIPWAARGSSRGANGALALVLGMLLFGFSKWAYPFGWVCWGPRFPIPWMPALVFLALGAQPGVFERALAPVLRSGRGFAAFCAALVLAGFAHASALFDRSLVDWLFLPDSVCPKLPVIQLDKAYYLGCIRHMAWSKPWVLARAFDPRLSPGAFVLSLLFSAVLVGLLVQMRGELVTGDPGAQAWLNR